MATYSGLLVKIDPGSRRVTRSVSLGVEPSSVAVGAGASGSQDANSPTLLRVEARVRALCNGSRLPTEGVALPSVTGTVAVGAGSLWVAHGSSHVARLDPDTGRLLASVEVPAANSVAVGDGSVWVAGSDVGLLAKIDPATNSVVARVKLQPYLCCVAVGGGLRLGDELASMEALAGGGRPVECPDRRRPANLTFSSAARVAEGISGKVTRIDPKSDATESFVTGGLVLNVEVNDGAGRRAVDEGPPDLTKGVKGPILHVQMPSDNLKPPILPWTIPASPRWRAQLAYATCASLLNYPDAPPVGWHLVARSPRPSIGLSRRQDIHVPVSAVGSGSPPPSNEPVTAGTSATIERSHLSCGPNAAGLRATCRTS